MSFKIDQRSYGGKKFRPNTVLDYEESNQLLICVTAWGQEQIASKVSESIKSYISLSSDDTEVTRMVQQKETLHKMGNTLRTAVIMASEKIQNEFNKDEYTAGFEIFAGIQDGPQWIYVSCGQPSLIIKRSQVGVIPITQSLDFNVLTQRRMIHDPLPNQLLGLGQNPPIQYGNIRLQAQDKMALISRTYIPNRFFQMEDEDFSLDGISRTLADENLEVPYWLAFIDLD